MAKLDTAWAISEIEAFLHVTESVASDEPGIIGFWMRGPYTEASERAHVVEQILDRVLPGWRKGRPAKDDENDWLRDRHAHAASRRRW